MFSSHLKSTKIKCSYVFLFEMAKLDHFHFKLGWFPFSHMSQEPERNLGLKQPSRGQGGKLNIGGFDEPRTTGLALLALNLPV